ncbi:MAG: tRNA adenosine(34) deaminase TadA [Thermodesulfobacteriaceae bacterium]|nr:tRNA adenosine(34) deaminase TadA [Thermodesulfobacteriaceae bacterium]MCX8041852.1 tRNA adenosine(34) deaminase TadA [Thermodesulfobacteriaceae bacterium]MDW8135661.1 tRNA adenosine(34) deaminase TadA [Thermodesulfobacterium sp.]
MFTEKDFYFMKIALEEAEKAFKEEEVPVGAVVVSSQGELLSQAHNQILKLKDPTAHAEILALRLAALKMGNYRLLGCKLYVTLEPCPMCAYAMVLARIEELIFATQDPKTGACESIYHITNDQRLNHQIKVKKGLFKEEASFLLKKFFQSKR